MSYILAIDPGNTESAYVVLDENMKPVRFDKVENSFFNQILIRQIVGTYKLDKAAIEYIASYGMAVGKEVFETCIWIGRFAQSLSMYGVDTTPIYRKDVKMHLCGSMKAKDSNIIIALKDRFGDKGTKAKPGWFFGFKSDVWQAYAIAVTYRDIHLKKETQ